MARTKRKIWAIDSETDPFLYGREPRPFAWGAVCENGDRVYFWGDDATAQFLAWAKTIPPALFVAHNGGKFDALFLRDGIQGKMLMIDGRIVQCAFLHHDLRDSFAVLPVALAKLGAKAGINYALMERATREANKAEIVRYLMQDCVVLLDAILAFYHNAGKRKLTVASTAFSELKKTAQGARVGKLGAVQDADLRRFYFGGRVQYFNQGIIHGDFKIYDVNSMYPHAMRNFMHPMGAGYKIKSYAKCRLPESGAYFADIEANTLGAFPVRNEKTRATAYLTGRHKLHISGHELNAALECGLVSNISGLIYLPNESVNFAEFVDTHYTARLDAKARGDSGADTFHKLMLVSAYGKLASSPEGKDSIYYCAKGEAAPAGYKPRVLDYEGGRIIAAAPVERPESFYNDVGIGASITGAARAVLMRAIAKSKGVLYCDTDSILCEEFGGGEIDAAKLGAWKMEATADCAAIAGKKLYVLLKNKRVVKAASKGVKACPTEIYRAAAGEIVTIKRDAPTMNLAGINFLTRDIKRT
jgi:hypothetical protein